MDIIKKIKKKVREKGAIYVLRYIMQYFFMIPALTPLFVVVLMMRPFKLIRFGSLNSSVIGHFAGNTDLYLGERRHGLHPKRALDIFFYEHVSNAQLLHMWRRKLTINKHAKYLYRMTFLIPWGDVHRIASVDKERDIDGLLEGTAVNIEFTLKEIEEARAQMKRMGISEQYHHICLLGRDSVYKKKVNPGTDWSYHDYRNVDIQNYRKAAESLALRGHHVIRMGSAVKEPLETDHPKVTEYALKGYRTELLDLYLSATCRFFIGCGSGIDVLAHVFRRPILYVNFVPFEYLVAWDPRSITVFKKHWLIKEKRYMTFREIIESGAGRFQSSGQFEKHGIELIENSPEEIHDACVEMAERLNGKWITNDVDIELQERFWSMFQPNDLNRVFRSMIGAKYLRQYKSLLD